MMSTPLRVSKRLKEKAILKEKLKRQISANKNLPKTQNILQIEQNQAPQAPTQSQQNRSIVNRISISDSSILPFKEADIEKVMKTHLANQSKIFKALQTKYTTLSEKMKLRSETFVKTSTNPSTTGNMETLINAVASTTANEEPEPHVETQNKQLENKLENLKELASTLMTKVRSYINRAMSVENYKNCNCYRDALRLGIIVKIMQTSYQLGNFIRVVGHSTSCRNDNCMISCRMLRRVRNHAIKTNDTCALLHCYGQLLRMHVDTCTDNNGDCGMASCRDLRKQRIAEKINALPADFLLQEKRIREIMPKRETHKINMDELSKTLISETLDIK